MTKSEQPLRIATVGTGYFSQFHYDAWRRLSEEAGIRIEGVCSLEIDEARSIADGFEGCRAFDDFETMLNAVKPDLVDVITGPATHVPFINAAAERGISVICQKPFTPSLADAETAVEVARDAGIRLIVHENFRFQPWHIKAKELIEAGNIGDPYQISFRFRPGDGQGPQAYLGRQPYFQKMERFLVHETLIHLVDVYRFYFGEMENVTAELAKLNPVIAGEDAGLVVCRFENGVRGLIDGNRLSDHGADNRRLTFGDMLIEGSEGALRLNGDAQLFFRGFGKSTEQKVDYLWYDNGFAGDCVYLTQKHIIEQFISGGPIANTAADYLANLRAEEAIYRSDKEGQRINLAASSAAAGQI